MHRKLRAMGMTAAAAESWVACVADPPKFVRFQIAVKCLSLVALAVTYLYGTRDMRSPIRELLQAAGTVKMASSVGWVVAMRVCGPDYAQTRFILWTSHMLVEVLVMTCLVIGNAMSSIELMPFHNRAYWLVGVAVAIWTAEAGAVSCAVPWERSYRSGTLLPVIATTTSRVLRAIDALSDIAYTRVLLDKVRASSPVCTD